MLFFRPFVWEPGFDELEVGLMMHPDFWGKNIGTDLAANLKSKMPPNIPFIALIEDSNIASKKLVERIGFEKLAPSKKYEGYWIWKINGA